MYTQPPRKTNGKELKEIMNRYLSGPAKQDKDNTTVFDNSSEYTKLMDAPIKKAKLDVVTSKYHQLTTTVSKPSVVHRTADSEVIDIMNRYLKPEDRLDNNDEDIYDPMERKAYSTTTKSYSTTTTTTSIPTTRNNYDTRNTDFENERSDYEKSEITDIMERYLGSQDRSDEPTTGNDEPWNDNLEIERYNYVKPEISDIMECYLGSQDRPKTTTWSKYSLPKLNFDPEVRLIMARQRDHKFNKKNNRRNNYTRLTVDPRVRDIVMRHRKSRGDFDDAFWEDDKSKRDPEIEELMKRYLYLNERESLGGRDFGVSKLSGLSALSRRESIRDLLDKYLPSQRLRDNDHTSYFVEYPSDSESGYNSPLQKPNFSLTSHRLRSLSSYNDLLTDTPPHITKHNTQTMDTHNSWQNYPDAYTEAKQLLSSYSSPTKEQDSARHYDRRSSIDSWSSAADRSVSFVSRISFEDDNEEVFSDYDIGSRVDRDKNRSGDQLWQIMARYLDEVPIDNLQSAYTLKRMFSTSSNDSGLGWLESEDGTTTGISER